MMLIKPIITEKTLALAQTNNQYTFAVSMNANKTEASKELEKQFNVEVVSVQAVSRLGKTYRINRNSSREGRKPNRKYMVFKLKDGNSIDIFKQ